MDIKKQYFELVKQRINLAYDAQKDKLKKVAEMFGNCMDNGGVVQLFGYGHCEEFVNELNYRAGGIAYFHACRIKDLVLNGSIKQEDVDNKSVFQNGDLIEKFEKSYQLDDRDMYVLVSLAGDEPLMVELAKHCKAKGQKVVAVINKKSYEKSGSRLLEYCDEYLDMCGEDPDVAIDLDVAKIGQLNSTVANVMAQMLTAEVYNYFVEHGKEAPVLLSANVKGADVHNNSLTDPYERRIR